MVKLLLLEGAVLTMSLSASKPYYQIFIVHLFGNLSSKETEPKKVTMHAADYEEVENKTVGETKPVLTS